ncbi:MAG: GNAT family N-acetyltransferase [Candidatus Caenarcaniphilales bacterium]|nr:GNAT family N-acetyltransferase [Candidatus Caenarcaniphilales bacterium]
MENFEIKLSTEKQFDEIWHIFHDVVQEADTYPYPPDIKKEEAKKLWYTADSQVYIAYIKGTPVATRYIRPNKVGLGSHIANTGVMIDKNYRGHGLGRKMMEFAIDEAKNLGYKAIQLNLVVSTNIASITICKTTGFEIIGKIPNAFHYKQKKYVDAYVMYKELN